MKSLAKQVNDFRRTLKPITLTKVGFPAPTKSSLSVIESKRSSLVLEIAIAIAKYHRKTSTVNQRKSLNFYPEWVICLHILFHA